MVLEMMGIFCKIGGRWEYLVGNFRLKWIEGMVVSVEVVLEERDLGVGKDNWGN